MCDSVVDPRLGPLSVKDYEIGCVSAKHAALNNKE